MRRHPLSNQAPPDKDGVYLVQEFPGDRWIARRFVDGEFRDGLMILMWWRWRVHA